MNGQSLLSVSDLVKRFHVSGPLGRTQTVHAVDGVSFEIGRGRTLGLVGESGCGKSTIGRMIVRLIEPTEGAIRIDGVDIAHTDETRLGEVRRKVQMVFQDPYGSLNPRMRAGDIVAEPLRVHGIARGSELADRVAALFRKVGLRDDQLRNRPGQFSGGQRQRIAIARALALGPSLIVADEPVSALDVSIQAQVVNLLCDLQDETGISFLFVAHDLGIVRHVSDDIAVMYLGRIVEMGEAEEVFLSPRHPYTRALIEAVPQPDPRRRTAKIQPPPGEVPSPIAPPSGCHFHPRCPLATALCRSEAPRLRPLGTSMVACHHAA
jgi:peptide/nickel transport system ATP-binding protein/oligopeptide transport system ATP-binding protein